MLLNNFFTITAIEGEEQIKGIFMINPDHEIFKGHFPEQPVVPGVTMVQMVHEILSIHTSTKYHLVASDYLKFLSVIVPEENVPVLFEINIVQGEQLQLSVTFTYKDTVAFKGKMTFLTV